MWIAIAGISLHSLVSGLVVMLLTWFGYLIETRFERPARSYMRAALASAALFCVLVVSVPSWGGDVVLSSITWAGMSVLGAFWAISYERIEPRS
jgi:ABC-type Co2+ transport system permease subunit